MRMIKWFQMFHQYERYSNGEEVEVPIQQLRYWANNLRKNSASLNEEQRTLLNGINFPWKIRNTSISIKREGEKETELLSSDVVVTDQKVNSLIKYEVQSHVSINQNETIVNHDKIESSQIDTKNCSFVSDTQVIENGKNLVIVIDLSVKENESRQKQSVIRSRRSLTDIELVGSPNKVLLVYPFVGGERIEKVASDMMSGFGPETKFCSDDLLSQQHDGCTSRAHYVTITEEDRAKYNPGQFLNDTLIDFWMKWYVCIE